MSSSLGLYIENNLIKYAKISKNNDNVKVESFGIKFFDKTEEAIKQIIEETYSYKVPISTNVPDEIYNYFDVFGGLKKKDIDGIVKTSFENFCYDNGLNKESYECRHIYTSSPTSKEKVRAIHVSTKKTSIARRKNLLSSYKITTMAPTSVAISNLLKQGKGQTSLIVNMEENTTITKVTDEGIKDIKILEIGSKAIFDKIKNKENSYSKAYEICKNSTIYTSGAGDLQTEENEFLTDIMPTLYEIVTELKKYFEQNLDSIDRVYLTGTLSTVNNIDIYFQEYIKSTKFEILKPYFVNLNSKINIKEYIEVNSALALALQDIEPKHADVNFVNKGAGKNLFAGADKKISLPKLNEIDLQEVLDKYSGKMFTLATVISTVLIAYIIATVSINTMYDNKNMETQNAIEETNAEISKINEYDKKLNSRITKYKSMVTAIEEKNNKIAENKRYKNLIPNLMNNLMVVIPKEVQLLSISNTNATHIVIEAKSAKYEQLAYFKTKIKNEKILKKVVSDAGVAGSGSIKVTIEGELP